MSKVDDLCETLVADLIASVDTVTGQWKPSWSESNLLPVNASTGKPYRGINTLFLWSAQLKNGYTSARWATYKQWEAIGGQVRKGEKGTGGVKWVDVNKDPDARAKLVPCGFTVFNVDQQDGWAAPAVTEVDVTEGEAEFAKLLATIPFKHAVGKPCYVPALDTVFWPERADFHSSASYVAVAAHELAHWSGAESRLKRDLTGRFGTDSYAAEELVAEISAALTCATFGVGSAPVRDDHARYVKHWLAVLKAEPKLLLTAAQAAQKASTFLLDFAEVEAKVLVAA